MARSFSLGNHRILLALVASLVLGLSFAAASASAATGPTPVACANLEAAMNGATEGEVLELSESCVTNVNVTNTKAFTLEGDGSAVLSPKTADTPIVQATTTGVRFALEDLLFEKGLSEQGGAIWVHASKEAVVLRDDTFLSNTAKNDGGAADVEDNGEAASEPTVIEGDVFGAPGEGDIAGGYAGGAAYLRISGPLRITHNSFIDDEVTSTFGGGGGLDVETSDPKSAVAPVQISGNTFTANRVIDSGGGAFVMAGGGQTVTLEGNLFSANRVAGKEATVPREGGGLVLAIPPEGASFHAVQAHNTFVGNIVEATELSSDKLAAGGGGEWVYGVDVQSTADIFSDNEITVDEGEPPEGGGLGVLGTSMTAAYPQLASFTGIDDLFLSNSIAPGGWGGAIYTGFQNAGCQPVETCTGSTTLVLDDSTVYANEVKAGSGSQGGALWGSPNDSLTVANSIIFGNSPQPEVWGYATGAGAPSFKYSDVCAESGGPLVPTGEGNICANPQLNGGGEETFSSPTIDAGSNALVPNGLTTDAFGDPRIFAGHESCSQSFPAIVDMGADELTPSALSCPGPVALRPPALGLTHFVSLKSSATGIALRLSCASSDGLGCSGAIFLSTDETVHGKRKKVIAVGIAGRGSVPVRVGQASFSLPAGASATFQVKLNATGLELLHKFHAFSAWVLANEAMVNSNPVIFLLHSTRFGEPTHKKHRKHKKRHVSRHPKHH
jgi:hypothetical protein